MLLNALCKRSKSEEVLNPTLSTTNVPAAATMNSPTPFAGIPTLVRWEPPYNKIDFPEAETPLRHEAEEAKVVATIEMLLEGLSARARRICVTIEMDDRGLLRKKIKSRTRAALVAHNFSAPPHARPFEPPRRDLGEAARRRRRRGGRGRRRAVASKRLWPPALLEAQLGRRGRQGVCSNDDLPMPRRPCRRADPCVLPPKAACIS